MSHRRRARNVKVSESRVRAHLESFPLSEPCPDCGKYRYMTRKAAKGARKRTNRSDSMSVYRCGEYWHIGHTPWVIRQGLQERSNTHNTWQPRKVS